VSSKDDADCRLNVNTVAPPKPNLTQRFLRIVCPFEAHPSRPQTLFKSSEDQTGKHSVTAQCDRVLISYRCAAVQSMQEVRAGIPPTVVNDT
jgi:hypothetical protein